MSVKQYQEHGYKFWRFTGPEDEVIGTEDKAIL